MLLLNAEFLAMLLIIVYVGAIAVLFLFVVMMLQTKYQHRPSKLQTAAAFFIATIVFVQIFSFITLKTGKEENMIITNIPGMRSPVRGAGNPGVTSYRQSQTLGGRYSRNEGNYPDSNPRNRPRRPQTQAAPGNPKSPLS